MIIESGPKKSPLKHFRACRDTVHLWRLEMAGPNQRWEKTPFRDHLDRLVDFVIDTFPWMLNDLDQNPERTSDRRH